MRKVLSAIINNALIIIIPLLFKPSLIINYKIIIIEVVTFALWLTQPVFSLEETRQSKENDKFSVLLILIMSVISIVTPVVDWAYFKNDFNYFGEWQCVSIVLILAGLGIRIWSIRQLGNLFTPTVQIQESHNLITSGPYSLVRHPSYLGAFLCIISGPILLNSLLGFITAIIAMGTAYYFRIVMEEKKLLLHFGDEYIQYKKMTKAFIPFIF
ncbi:MAG: isoprenylcysteine carboxylmethyltransferase family protein [Bacteroidetes bacterium]|nr:isoprenylcysteine carboxylmethyltransferase family protein [Bacteroidota bacterium]